MNADMLDQPATPEQLRRLARYGYLDAAALDRAFVLTGQLPDRAAWRRFANVVLLALGAAFTLSGVIFFFAFNWDDLHRFVKLGLAEVAILTAVGLALFKGLDTLVGKISLMAASILTGALLAVFGQTYQTGADSYQLFLTWIILIVGWAAVGAFQPLWLLLLALANITLILFWEQRVVLGEAALFELLVGINAAALGVWEWARRRGVAWLRGRWFAQLIALAVFIFLTIPTLEFIFDSDGRDLWSLALAPWLFVVVVAVMIAIYARWLRDLLILTVGAFSIVVIVTATVGELLDGDAGGFIVLSALVVLQAGVALTLLRRVARSWEEVQP